MKLCIHVRPRDDGQGWAVDVFDGRRAWSKTHLGESPLSKAEAHRLAHKLRDPKFYTARTKRAVNSGGAWVDPVLRDYAREAARLSGVEFSRWVERAVRQTMARESADRAMVAASERGECGTCGYAPCACDQQ